MSTWIKRSEREPTAADLPIRTGYYYDNGEWGEYTHVCLNQVKACPQLTHWRSIKCEPPARELTQREKDNDAAKLACEREFLGYGVNWPAAEVAVRKAIYAERREVDRLLTNWFGANWSTETFSACSSLGQLRARLDEQGGE
jgi:hypothetical protein